MPLAFRIACDKRVVTDHPSAKLIVVHAETVVPPAVHPAALSVSRVADAMTRRVRATPNASSTPPPPPPANRVAAVWGGCSAARPCP
uniref:Transposase n=1 Tax=Mesocestoides corti TaxID=53468 RepID=A0A5K3G3K6_MESCO